MRAPQARDQDEHGDRDPTFEAVFNEIREMLGASQALRELLSASQKRLEAPLRQEIDFLRRELAAASAKPLALDVSSKPPAPDVAEPAALVEAPAPEASNGAAVKAEPLPTPSSVTSMSNARKQISYHLRPSERPITSHMTHQELEQLVEEAKTLALEEAERKKHVIKVPVPKSKLDFVDNVIDPFVSVIIIVNFIMIGVATDNDYQWVGWMYVDLGFTISYLFEAVIKIMLLGCKGFFFGPSAQWNRFDFAVILFGAFDSLVYFASYSGGAGSGSFVILRVLRLTRIGRVLRLVHFSVFKELFTMLAGLVAALRTLLWAFVILLFPMYTMSLMLTQFLGHVHQDDKRVMEHFSTVPISMLMVFRCSIGDCSFSDGTPTILHISSKYGWVYAASYVAGTMLITFGIFNLIMATFVDNALAAARRNEKLQLHERLCDIGKQAQMVSTLIERVWECLHPQEELTSFNVHEAMSMTIAAEQFDELIEDSEIQEILEELDIPEDDRRGLFDVLDADGGGRLEMEELIRGIVKLRGDPRRSDVVHIGLVIRSLQDEFRRFRSQMTPILSDLADAPRVSKGGHVLI